MWGIESTNHIEKFSSRVTVHLKMTWVSDIICVYLFLILFRTFGGYRNSCIGFMRVLEHFLWICRFVLLGEREPLRSSNRFRWIVLKMTSKWIRVIVFGICGVPMTWHGLRLNKLFTSNHQTTLCKLNQYYTERFLWIIKLLSCTI